MDEASTSESEDDGEESDGELMDDDGAAPLVAHWPTTSPSTSDNSDDNSDDTPLCVAARRGPSAAQARFNALVA